MVFEAFNHPESNLCEQYGVRSFSVGDMILFSDGVYYICANYGWKTLDRAKAIEYQKFIRESMLKGKGEWAAKDDFLKLLDKQN